MPWTDTTVNGWLNFGASLYLGLHYGNPALGGLGSAEVSGGSYARQNITLATPQARATYNTVGCVFQGMPAVTVQYLGLWDAAGSGNLVAYIAVTPNVAVAAGGTFSVNPGDVAFTFGL